MAARAATINSSTKAQYLQDLCRAVGVSSSGPKKALRDSLKHHLTLHSAPTRAQHVRLLSVDMGIQNLAYSLLEYNPSDLESVLTRHQASGLVASAQELRSESIHHFKLLGWDRLAVLDYYSLSGDLEPTALDISMQQTAKSPPDDGAIKPSKRPFNIDGLARAASHIVHSLFLPLNPTHLVIERQRHRSGSNPNVLEWTFRVNMLEAMLWASLRSMQDLRKRDLLRHDVTGNSARQLDCIHDLQLASVEPKRMSNYWQADRPSDLPETSKVLSRTKAMKEERIALVAGLLQRGLNVSGQAATQRDAFLASSERKPKAAIKKDDLADCLLQGLAFSHWQANARHLSQTLSFQDEPEEAIAASTSALPSDPVS